jgi:OOP family OmpA-OmpF porin
MLRSFSVFALTLFVALIQTSHPAFAAAVALPDYFKLPANVHAAEPTSITYEKFGEDEFYVKGDKGQEDQAVTKTGQHWTGGMVVDNPTETEGKKIFEAAVKPSLLKAGWTITSEYDSNPYSVMMRYQAKGKDAWMYLKIFAVDDLRLHLIEAAGPPAAFNLPEPEAKPEIISADSGDFPYLLPLPGSVFGSSTPDGGAMLMHLPGSSEDQIVAPNSIQKFYRNPPSLSTLQFVTVYAAALKQAGWTMLYANHGTDATLTAHYSKRGRDLWAELHMGAEEYKVQVGDAGAGDLARKLEQACHVAVYGVHFDFNKSTLKPESTEALTAVLGLLQKDAALKLEIQGHTDNVGGSESNQKLSEARARSVVGWLAHKGIAGARLTSQGYGKNQPVATNETELGRAQNRRVEIAKPGCQPRK